MTFVTTTMLLPEQHIESRKPRIRVDSSFCQPPQALGWDVTKNLLLVVLHEAFDNICARSINLLSHFAMRLPIIFYPAASGLIVLLVLFLGAASGMIAAGIAIAACICVATMNHQVWRNYSKLKCDDFADMYASAKGIDNAYLSYVILCITLPLSAVSYFLLTSDYAAERNFDFVNGNPLGSLTPLYSHMQSIADDRLKSIFAKPLLPFFVATTYTAVAFGGALMCAPAIVISWAARTGRQSRYLTGLTAVLGLIVAAITTNISLAKLSSGCISEIEPGKFSLRVYPYIECVTSISALLITILFISITIGCVISILKGITHDRREQS